MVGHHDGLGKVLVQGEAVHRVPGGLGGGQQGLTAEEHLRIDGEPHALHGQGKGGLDVPGLQEDPGGDVVAGEEPIRHAPDPVVLIQEDEGHVSKGQDVHAAGECKALFIRLRPEELLHAGLGHHQKQPFPAQLCGLEGVQVPGHVADEQVDAALRQVFLKLRGGALQNGDGDAGVLLVEGGQEPRQQRLAPGVADADTQLAGVVVREIVQFQVELPLDVADLLGGGLQPLAGGGQGEAGIALKELGVQLLFQLADLPGEGLLGDVEPPGGLRHVHFLGHGQEVG